MIRAERRRRIKEYEKELKYIFKHTPYLKFLDTNEFMLPKDELELLVANNHENKSLQHKFNVAKDLFARVDALTTLIRELKDAKTATHPEHSEDKSPHPQNELS